MTNYLYNHGDWCQDIISGFSGVVTGRADYITGCNQYLLQPPLDDDQKFVESRWTDEQRLKCTKRAYTVLEPVADRPPGADRAAPRK